MTALICAMTDDPGDREFMLMVYESHKDLMMTTAQKYIADRDIAEDIVHDGVVKLIEKVSLLRTLNRCTLAGYIVSTVRNTAISYLRRQDTLQKHSTPMEEEMEEAAELTVEELTILQADKAQLCDAWPKLSEEDRLLLEGKYLLEQSDEELAALLGCKVASIRMKLTRARRRAYLLVAGEEVVE